MAKKKPAATASTNDAPGSCVDVQCRPKRRVTYVLSATSSANLSIPVAVAIGGQVDPKYLDKPGRISGANGKLSVLVDPGATVSLYLNSDAHPDYRKNPVYPVTPVEHDIWVAITEKAGKHSDSDTPVLKTSKEVVDPTTGARQIVDHYAAPLTGDIWLKVSHKYAASEVEALLPGGTCDEVKAAVKNIYGPLNHPSLNLAIAAVGEKKERKIAITFADSDNPKQNITKYDLLVDGLTRVHPAGYAALFNAALENNIGTLALSSAWRPLLGSIAHRAGLGLDINYVGGTRMNREELRRKDAVDTSNVSQEEKKLFKQYENAATESDKSQTALKQAERDSIKFKKDPIKGPAAEAALESRFATAKVAQEKAEASKKAWDKERDQNEPLSVREFRGSLLKCSCVKQLFDPWFMDANTLDKAAPEPNLQRGATTSNERLHSHHMHITVNDPKIL
jgi:hypothetical protein